SSFILTLEAGLRELHSFPTRRSSDLGWLGLRHHEMLQLTTAALLHDVGKMLVPEDILNKPDVLTEEEFEEMKNHTIYGYNLLKEDRKSTRLNSSHVKISYAVFCLKKK